MTDVSRPAPTAFIVSELTAIQRTIERLILGTPTSEERNKLCDANIHISEAINRLTGD